MTKAKINNIQLNDNLNNEHQDEYNIINDVHYVCKSSALMSDFLKKGCDVMQLINGDLIVTEVKSATFHYSWDEKKEKLIRVYGNSKSKKSKESEDDNFEHEHELEYID